MSDLRKAAEMALDALHNIDQSNNYDAIEALRQALAQPEEKMHIEGNGKLTTKPYPDGYESEQQFRQALAKREWVGLTDQEVSSVYKSHVLLAFYKPYRIEEYEWVFWLTNFARDIEEAIKEKNT